MKKLFLLALVFALFTRLGVSQINSPADTPLRVIVFFAHPDDGEKMGGTAAMMAKAGIQVKFVCLTNGDAGHQVMGGGALGVRRRAEAMVAKEKLGIAEYEVWDNHDGELLPELHIRKDVIRAIREWNADVVIGHRPNDYHPDHRNAGQLVIDASYLVIVPNVAADTPPVKNNPVFLYLQDRFSKPNPFSYDIVIGTDEGFEAKLAATNAYESQMYEWLPWTSHTLDQVPETPEERFEWLRKRHESRKMSEEARAGLVKWYGEKRAKEFKYAEAFEIAEYGKRPNEEEIRMLFPMLKK